MAARGHRKPVFLAVGQPGDRAHIGASWITCVDASFVKAIEWV
jgi:hypothetical protein